MTDDKRNKKLSHLQELAVRQLAKGKTLAAAARAVGVSRQTVYNWMSAPAFVAAMNRWRESAVTLVQGQILAGLDAAADTVVQAARDGDARIAMTLLEKSGVFAPLARQSTDPDQIAREQALAQRSERAALDRAECDLAEAEELNILRRVHDLPPTPLRVPPSAPKKTPATSDSPSPPPPAPNPPEPPPVPASVLAKRRASPRPRGYVSDRELEKAIADADALKAKEAAWQEKQRKAREQQPPQPPPVSHGVSPAPSHPSHHPKARRRRHAYSRGMPEPIDELDDQFTDIWREDRK